MSNEMEELMQKSVIREDTELSKMISDIVPTKEADFTNLEIEANKKSSFSLVIYKEENIFTKFVNTIKTIFEKIRIMNYSRDFDLGKINNK